MRLARLWVDGRDVAAIAHDGRLYRVDRLDAVLGAPLPPDILPVAQTFSRRVFGLAMAGLDDHEREILEGMRLGDCEAPAGAVLLPPCGRSPALLQATPGVDLPLRLDGRALFGHERAAPTPFSGGALWVQGAVALVLGEDLHLPAPDEIAPAIGGLCLALAWGSTEAEASSLRAGLGPAPGREPGTHLGPWLTTGKPPPSVTLEVEVDRDRRQQQVPVDLDLVARSLSRLGRAADLLAGDVVLLPAQHRIHIDRGQWARVSAPALGALRGRVG